MENPERIFREVTIGMTLTPELECHLMQMILDGFEVAEGSV